MIEIQKVAIQEKESVKKVGVKYIKDGVSQPFCIIPYNELNNGLGDVALKQAVLDYLS